MHLYNSLILILVAFAMCAFAITGQTPPSSNGMKQKQSVAGQSSPAKKNRIAGMDKIQYCGQQSLPDQKEGYFCGQIRNGQQGKYGIRFYDNDNFYCGEFQNGEPNGRGYIYYADSATGTGHYCGEISNGQAQGQGAYQHFKTNEMNIGRHHDGKKDGSIVTYWPENDKSAKGWWSAGVCKQGVWYDPNGYETKRNANACS